MRALLSQNKISGPLGPPNPPKGDISEKSLVVSP